MTDADRHWWRNAVVYQIYPRSFADGNGDGTGDIAGIRQRLPHLLDLGVDAIWITPWYRSPMCDGGYDVADFREIDPRFGSNAEADLLLAECRAAGIKVIVDLVPNHTSDRHAWFVEALAQPAGSPARDRYLFRDGRGDHAEQPPNDWGSIFGGSAWEPVGDGQWYLHIFDRSQPDLNWHHPEVREEFEAVMRHWLARGVDGFRIDVAHGMFKDMDFPDLDGKTIQPGCPDVDDHPFWDRPEIHGVVRGWRRLLEEHPGTMMVAEASVRADRIADYLRPDAYHQSFDFDLLAADWNAASFSKVIQQSISNAAAVGAVPTWVLSNHDVMRHATRYGLPAGTNWRKWPVEGPYDALDSSLGRRRAMAAGLVQLALPGSSYLYQGDELALPDAWDLTPDVLDDPIWFRTDGREKGRDGCRVPMPWAVDGPSLGFGAGGGWLPQPAAYADLSVEAQRRHEGSALELYRSALRLRGQWLAVDEAFEWLDLGPDVVAFERGSGLRCIANMGNAPVALPSGRVAITSAPRRAGHVMPDTAVWLLS